MATFRYPIGVNDGPSSKLPADAMSRGATTDYLVITVLDTSSSTGGFNPFANFGVKGFSGEGKPVHTIYLHMPNQIQANYQVAYNDVDLGALGVTAVKAMQDGGTSPEQIEALAKSMAPEVAASAVATAIGAANAAVGAGGSVSAAQLQVLTQRKAFNTYKENVFDSVGFRQHSFNIKMVARNKEEAAQIKGIINVLKYAMHPKFSSGSGIGGTGGSGPGIAANRWMDIPFSFGLEYKRLGNNSKQLLYKFMPSVLLSMNVDYTPDGNYVTGRTLTEFNDHGLAVNLQMTFKETRLITKENLAEDETSITY